MSRTATGATSTLCLRQFNDIALALITTVDNARALIDAATYVGGRAKHQMTLGRAGGGQMPGVPFTANRWTSTTCNFVRQCLLGPSLIAQTLSIDVPPPFYGAAALLRNTTPLARTHSEADFARRHVVRALLQARHSLRGPARGRGVSPSTSTYCFAPGSSAMSLRVSDAQRPCRPRNKRPWPLRSTCSRRSWHRCALSTRPPSKRPRRRRSGSWLSCGNTSRSSASSRCRSGTTSHVRAIRARGRVDGARPGARRAAWPDRANRPPRRVR